MTKIGTSTEAIAAIMEGVTPGPWFPNSPSYHVGMIEVAGPSLTCRGFTIATDVDDEKAASIKSDASFIAASRDLVPALTAERDAMRAEIERLRATPPEVTALVEALREVVDAHECGVGLWRPIENAREALAKWEAAQK